MSKLTRKFDGYDIIGDVHGCASALRRLLGALDYQETAQGYEYSNKNKPRQAVFVGDLIDRGDEVAETLALVKAMWDAGNAQVVMGNHELTAIAWHTPYQQGFIRPRTARSYQQLQATLEQFSEHRRLLASYIEWFRELPLFLEMDNFRVVHACWDSRLIAQYQAQYQTNLLVDDILFSVPEQGSFAAYFLERITRGISLPLPNGLVMYSYHGFPRQRFRVKFWTNQGETYQDIAFQPDPLPERVATRLLSDEERSRLLEYDEQEKPLFVGHYWLQGQPEIIQSNIACVDYSAVNGGLLTAYRMQHDDKRLFNDRFCSISVQDKL